MNYERNEHEQAWLDAVKPLKGQLETLKADSSSEEWGQAALSCIRALQARDPKTPDWRPDLGVVVALMDLSTVSASVGMAWLVQRLAVQLAQTLETSEWAEAAESFKAGENLVALAIGPTDATLTIQADGSARLTGVWECVPNAAAAERLLAIVQGDEGPELVSIDAKAVGVALSQTASSLMGSADIRAEDVAIAADCRAAFKASSDLRRAWNLGLAAVATGLMRHAMAVLQGFSAVAKEGAKPLAADQNVRYTLAELLTRVQTAELFVARAAWLGREGDFEAETVGMAVKAFVSDEVQTVTTIVHQIAGRAAGGRGGFFTQALSEAATLAVSGTTADKARSAIADDLLARYEV